MGAARAETPTISEPPLEPVKQEVVAVEEEVKASEDTVKAEPAVTDISQPADDTARLATAASVPGLGDSCSHSFLTLNQSRGPHCPSLLGLI